MAGKAKVWAGSLPAAPVPIEKSADFEMDVGGRIEANSVAERLTVALAFEDVGTTRKPKKAAEDAAASATPPRRAHGTLQPRMKVS